MSKKVLVTGGAGFIGSHLVEALLKEGYDVSVVDNLSTGSKSNLAQVFSDIQWVNGDIRDLELCRKVLDGIDIVFHLAALGSVKRSVDNPIDSQNVNCNGTLNLLQAVRERGVRRFVYSSSSSVYGDTEILPKKESMAPNPKSPYAVSKLGGEYYSRLFWGIYGLETICLRYFNVFGPRQNPDSIYAPVIPKFVKALLMKKQPTIYGDGSQSRDFTYVSNVVDANLLAAKAGKECFGKVFNIACHHQVTIFDLFVTLRKLCHADIQPCYEDRRPWDVRHTLADIQLAKEYLRYEPRIIFQVGIQKTFDWVQHQWMRQNQKPLQEGRSLCVDS